MTAIFHGTSWLTFGFYSLAHRDWEEERVPSSSGWLCWEMVSHLEVYLHWVDPGLHLLCHRNHRCYKSVCLEPMGSDSCNKYQGSAQLHLLSWAFVVSDIAGDQLSAATPVFSSGAICCRDLT